MEACYINTAHPHFLNGHRAIAIVNERMTKDTKPRSVTNGTLSSSPTPETESNGSLFGSFFPNNKKNNKKTLSPVLEAVVIYFKFSLYSCFINLHSLLLL